MRTFNNPSPKIKDLHNKQIAFFIAVIHEFAKAFNLTYKQSCNYLVFFGGIDFLVNHYQIEHTLSLSEVLDDVQAMCKKTGGKI